MYFRWSLRLALIDKDLRVSSTINYRKEFKFDTETLRIVVSFREVGVYAKNRLTVIAVYLLCWEFHLCSIYLFCETGILKIFLVHILVLTVLTE